MVSANSDLLTAGPILSIAIVLIANSIAALLNDVLLGKTIAGLFGKPSTFFATNTRLSRYAWRKSTQHEVKATAGDVEKVRQHRHAALDS